MCQFTSKHSYGKASQSISPDEFDLYRQDQLHLARIRCRHDLALRTYKISLVPEIVPQVVCL